jgi:hypothetical protein
MVDTNMRNDFHEKLSLMLHAEAQLKKAEIKNNHDRRPPDMSSRHN